MKTAPIALGVVLLAAIAFVAGAFSGYAEGRTEAAVSTGQRTALALTAIDKNENEFARNVMEGMVDSSLIDFSTFQGGPRPISLLFQSGSRPSIQQVAKYRVSVPSRSPDHEGRVRMNRLAVDLQ